MNRFVSFFSSLTLNTGSTKPLEKIAKVGPAKERGALDRRQGECRGSRPSEIERLINHHCYRQLALIQSSIQQNRFTVPIGATVPCGSLRHRARPFCHGASSSHDGRARKARVRQNLGRGRCDGARTVARDSIRRFCWQKRGLSRSSISHGSSSWSVYLNDALAEFRDA